MHSESESGFSNQVHSINESDSDLVNPISLKT